VKLLTEKFYDSISIQFSTNFLTIFKHDVDNMQL